MARDRWRTSPSAPGADERELLVLLAGPRAGREAQRERIRQIAATADPQRLSAAMERQRMLPLLGTRLLEAAPDVVPAALAEQIGGAAAREAGRGAAQELLTLDLVGALERDGVRCVPLKGQTLSRLLYGAPGLRAAADVDLLVGPADLWDAANVLERRGFSVVPDRRLRDGLPLLHLLLRPPPGTGFPMVELHWRLHWHERSFGDRLVAHSREDRLVARRPVPAHELAALLLFYARDGFVGLRQAADIAAWWDAQPETAGGDALRGVATAHPALWPALRAAALVCAELLGTARPDLADLPAPRRRERLAMRLANPWGEGGRGQIAANVALVDACLSPRGSLPEFARRALTAPDDDTTTVAHASKTVARFGAALWRLRREGTLRA